jgi:DNA-3-methyladenine glycosylase
VSAETHDVLENFCNRPAPVVARALIGACLVVRGVGGIVTEVEAYARDDPASHSFRGQTARNRAMFGPPGHAYVYRSYGLHWCLNIVCQTGEAVLFRALQPTVGIAVMEARRGVDDHRRLCAGPGNICQALAVTGADDGAAFSIGSGALQLQPAQQAVTVLEDARIGISKATDVAWRFGLAGSSYVSRRFSPT